MEASFNELLLESIDEALSSLGEKPKKATYIYLETKFNIKKQEIPNRINVFSAKLRGNEYVASEHIFSKVSLNDYVRLMRHNFEEKKQFEVEIRVLASEQEELQRCR